MGLVIVYAGWRAVEKLREWEAQDAEIVYWSSQKETEDVPTDEVALNKYGFPSGPVFFRRDEEEYKDVAERIRPDILIEDDCESIGGKKEMTYPRVRSEIQRIISLSWFGNPAESTIFRMKFPPYFPAENLLH